MVHRTLWSPLLLLSALHVDMFIGTYRHVRSVLHEGRVRHTCRVSRAASRVLTTVSRSRAASFRINYRKYVVLPRVGSPVQGEEKRW